jgi:hypothetical protein
MMGQNVAEGFQGLGKHGRKKGTLNLYDIYGTHWGGRGTQIDPINDAQVFVMLPYRWKGNEKLYKE